MNRVIKGLVHVSIIKQPFFDGVTSIPLLHREEQRNTIMI